MKKKTAFILKYGKEKEKGRIPTDWNNVTFKEYVNFLKSNTIEERYSSLTGISLEMWEKPHDARLFANLDKVLRFTNTEPLTELVTHIEDNGKFWEINNDFMTLPLKEYEDMKYIIGSIVPEGEEVENWQNVEIIPKLIAVIACEEYKNMEQIESIAKRIELMPSDIVYTIGGFFLRKLTELNNGTTQNAGQNKSLASNFKRVIQKFLAILVVCMVYITSPMAIITSIRNFKKRVFKMFTGGYSYKIESIPQMKDIKN